MQIVNYWIDMAAEFLADQRVRPWGAANAAKKLTITYEPYPLVGVITPWNGPLSVPLADIPAALMAGCAVLSKPSEVTPLVWRMAVDGWKEIGAPDVLDARLRKFRRVPRKFGAPWCAEPQNRSGLCHWRRWARRRHRLP